ncbi:metal ABC transporter substrate-binding protein [Brooklawnia cerclae]|uniref:Zinc transport system substrate-binding protein n=1 Tax=Brooklawnia cerclae TaxID=349934 RepID=A0ABX0SCN9_9ACTN|nr:metal ABC transporter substrate-binding protein [Brooklawnia cerclae]NIH56163.1 zinc transport system substrate-binding protein [Brooklawnia cerclae]
MLNQSIRRLSAAALAAGLLAVTACSSGDAQGSSDARTSIVVSAYPFQFVAERVAGDLADVTNLLNPGAEAHDLELTPQQVEAVATADLVIYQDGYQTAFDEAVDQGEPAHIVDSATFLELRTADEDEHADEGESTESEEEHEHGAYDPHVWLDPENLAEIGRHVATELAGIDPDHASEYSANADTLASDLSALDDEFSTGLANCQVDTFITNHAAFGYLAARYGLTQVGISGLSPEEEPSPARIAEVQQEATEHNVTTIFYETAVSPKVAESIAGDLGLATDVLDPLETLSDQSRGSDYIAVMESNLESLKTANTCQ